MDTIDDEMIAATLGVMLKHQSDQVKAGGRAEAELGALTRWPSAAPARRNRLRRTESQDIWSSSSKRCASVGIAVGPSETVDAGRVMTVLGPR